MSIASPSLRSSSTTAPRPSLSSWLTCIVALPSTTLTVTGMSYTASRSRALRGALESAAATAPSGSSTNSTSLALVAGSCHALFVQQPRRDQHGGNLAPQRRGIADRDAVAPRDTHVARRQCIG